MKTVLKWICLGLLLAAVVWMAAGNGLGTNVQTINRDTDGNGYKEQYLLEDHRLQVYENHRLIWRSPQDWKIQQFILADADNDKQTELLMVVWKHGSFGNAKPFWVEGPDNKYSCHLFLYHLRSGKLKSVWCSSALVNPIIEMKVKDSNEDGLNELNILEGPRAGFGYSLRQFFSRHNTLWIWDNWGFKRID
jgi:hypothetical protein